MPVFYRPMNIADYAAVIELWQSVEGVGLSHADSREAIARYLERNPGMSFTAWDGEMLVGAVLCGHDGRRGFLHHLAVRESHRQQGIGRALALRCEQALQDDGIDKAHLFVFQKNVTARAFWQRSGWYERPELALMSREIRLRTS